MSQAVVLEFNLPELSQALAKAGSELYGFAMALWANDEQARKEIADVLLLALEQGYFVRSIEEEGQLSYAEHREAIYSQIFRRAEKAFPEIDPEISQEIRFYALSSKERAAVYLRARAQMTWDSIATIVSCQADAARNLVTGGRERLLGRIPFELPEELY